MTEHAVAIGGMALSEFIRRFEQDGAFELIEGEIVPMSPNVSIHAVLIKRVLRLLLPFEDKGLGEVFTEATFILEEKSDWVKGSRIPDLMFISAEQLKKHYAQENWESKPFALIPELVVEIVSPTDNYTDVNRKAQLYLADGVKRVWVFDPQAKQIAVHTSGTNTITILQGDDMLIGGSVLPDFKVRVKDIFI